MVKLDFEYAEQFEVYMYNQGMARSTILRYLKDVRMFLRWVKADYINEITEADLMRFRIYMLAERDVSHVTINNFIASLKKYFRFLNKFHNIKDITVNLKITSMQRNDAPKYISFEQLMAMIKAANTGRRIGNRNRAIMWVLFSTGIRLAELVGLNIDSFNTNFTMLEISGRIAKGAKKREIPFVMDEARKELLLYLKNTRPILMAGCPYTNALFVGDTGKRLSLNGLRNSLKLYAQKAGVTENVTPHTMRHSLATYLYQNGVDLATIKKILGHASIETTMIYAYLDQKKVQNDMKMALDKTNNVGGFE